MDKFKEPEINIINEFKESVKNIIAYQDVKIDKKIEEFVQPMSIQIKDISSKQNNQIKIFSTYEDHL